MNTIPKAGKKIFTHRPFFNLFILFLFVIFLVGCGTVELDSRWKKQAITVDGNSSDWLGALYFFECEDISVGFLNDESDLYVCLIAAEPTLRTQVMMQGFTAWFDPEGGKEKTFGIRFPLGRQAIGEDDVDIRMRGRDREQDPQELQERFQESLTELEIIRPGKDKPHRIPVKEVKGIEVKINLSGGMVVYELKVPLRSGEQFPYAIGTQPGDAIGLGLEIPKFDPRAMRGGMGGRRPGGGMGGMRGGRGGMGMGGRRPQMPRGLDVWVSLQLAAAEN